MRVGGSRPLPAFPLGFPPPLRKHAGICIPCELGGQPDAVWGPPWVAPSDLALLPLAPRCVCPASWVGHPDSRALRSVSVE